MHRGGCGLGLSLSVFGSQDGFSHLLTNLLGGNFLLLGLTDFGLSSPLLSLSLGSLLGAFVLGLSGGTALSVLSSGRGFLERLLLLLRAFPYFLVCLYLFLSLFLVLSFGRSSYFFNGGGFLNNGSFFDDLDFFLDGFSSSGFSFSNFGFLSKLSIFDSLEGISLGLDNFLGSSLFSLLSSSDFVFFGSDGVVLLLSLDVEFSSALFVFTFAFLSDSLGLLGKVFFLASSAHGLAPFKFFLSLVFLFSLVL